MLIDKSESLSMMPFALSAALLSPISTSKYSSLWIIYRFHLECEASSLILRFLNISKRLIVFNSVHSTDKNRSATSYINEKLLTYINLVGTLQSLGHAYLYISADLQLQISKSSRASL